MAMRHSMMWFILTPRYRKRTSPIRQTASLRLELSIARTRLPKRTVFPSGARYLFERYPQDFLLYGRILRQQLKDKDKIYSLHEPQVYCIAMGKDHIQYENGSKASIACTARSNNIVGVVSHEQNRHDSHTLPEILKHVETSRGKTAKQAVCDRGYRGDSAVNGTKIILPGKALKREKVTKESRSENNAEDAQSLSLLSVTSSRTIDWSEII